MILLAIAILALSFALWWLVVRDVDAAEADQTSCTALKGSVSPVRCTCVAVQQLHVEQEEPQRVELWRQWEWCSNPSHPESGFLILRRYYQIEASSGMVRVPDNSSDGNTILYPPSYSGSIMTAPIN